MRRGCINPLDDPEGFRTRLLEIPTNAHTRATKMGEVLDIGGLTETCADCGARKFKNEKTNCCNNGSVVIAAPPPPPAELRRTLDKTDPNFDAGARRVFKAHSRAVNNAMAFAWSMKPEGFYRYQFQIRDTPAGPTRGTPHKHIALWLEEAPNTDEIDSIISAEILDRDTCPELYDLVIKHMVHECEHRSGPSPGPQSL